MTAKRLRNRSGDAVFLCYHSVADSGPPFLSVRADSLERHLATLRTLGFRSGTLQDIGYLAAGGKPDGRLVFLTFDDAYLDNYVTARPLLDAYGFRALIFLVPPLVDGGDALNWERVHRQVRDHPRLMRSMTWPMVEEMAADGHEFGSHTLTHARLPELGDEQLREELSGSRERIVERLGHCHSVAYPFGVHTPHVARVAAEVGYSVGFTLPYGAQRDVDQLTIPRISVDHRDDERSFRRKLTPAYRAAHLSRLRPAVRKVLGRRPSHAEF